MLERPISKQNGGRLLSSKPFLVEVPKFLLPTEADILIRLVRGKLDPEEHHPPEIRDVSKYNCEEEECLLHPLVGEIYRRVSELLGIGPENFENLEFLRYGKRQHYKVHPDAIPLSILLDRPNERGAGQRMLSVFFYLSDVEKGGETSFPKAKPFPLLVKPEIGKMIVWSNIGTNPWKQSKYAVHQAVRVRKGVKWSAIFWVRPMDIRTPEKFSEHCDGDSGDDDSEESSQDDGDSGT